MKEQMNFILFARADYMFTCAEYRSAHAEYMFAVGE